MTFRALSGETPHRWRSSLEPMINPKPTLPPRSRRSRAMPVRHSDRRQGFSHCLYKAFVTWKLGWAKQPAEGLPTRWRPLYDRYGPVRPRLLRCSAVPSPEPPTTPAIVRLLFSFQRFCLPLLVLWSVSRGPVVSLSHFSFSVWPSGLKPFGLALGRLLESVKSELTPAGNPGLEMRQGHRRSRGTSLTRHEDSTGRAA